MSNNPPLKPGNNSITDQAEEENTDNQAKPRRRIQDGITPKHPGRKMNLDRRLKNNERRSNIETGYKGPSRRFTIDRRLKTKDRRETD